MQNLHEMGGVARESCPKLLNLMSNNGSHDARGGQEEKKLELRLGPPGEPNNNNNNNNLGDGNNKELVGLLPARSRIPPQTQFSFDITSGKDDDFKKPHNTSSQKRSAPGPVVGWPPIRSFRKNNCPKPTNSSPHDSKKLDCENPTEKTNDIQIKGGSMFVKINMEGVAIGRKVDLMAYDSYDKLSSAVDVLFRGLLQAQRDNDGVAELKPIHGEYTLVYEDNEGDKMLLGDVPWLMFLSTVKRLRMLKKTTQLPSLGVGRHNHDKTPQNEQQLMR